MLSVYLMFFGEEKAQLFWLVVLHPAMMRIA